MKERRGKLDNANINIAEINNNLQQSYIHYDPERVDYTISNFELELLKQAGGSVWKDIFLASLGIAIPTILNGLCSFTKLENKEVINGEIFLNFLIGGISLSLAVICLIVWKNNEVKFTTLIKQIKDKPKYRLPNA